MFPNVTSSFKWLAKRASKGFQHEDKPLVVVFGATGAQGSSVVKALLESGKYRVRGVTRHPESERAQTLTDCGVEMVKADQRNSEELEAALDGAYAAYVVTDFYSVGLDEFELGKRTVEAAKARGVQHLLLSTLPDVAELTGGRLTVPHFSNKAKLDNVVRSLNFPHHTFIVCAFYFQNFEKFGFAQLEPATSADASPTVVFRLPMKPNDMLTAFDVDDTGAAVVNALQHPDVWQDKYMCLAGFHAPIEHYAQVFAKVTGRPARFEATRKADTEEFTEMFQWFSAHTYFGPYDITNARRCNPLLKDWEEWLRATGWHGPQQQKEQGEGQKVGEGQKGGEGQKMGAGGEERQRHVVGHGGKEEKVGATAA